MAIYFLNADSLVCVETTDNGGSESVLQAITVHNEVSWCVIPEASLAAREAIILASLRIDYLRGGLDPYFEYPAFHGDYRHGSGLDCSGLVQWLLNQHGYDWGDVDGPEGKNCVLELEGYYSWSAKTILKNTLVLPSENLLEPGDLVGHRSGKHVGIYVGEYIRLPCDSPIKYVVHAAASYTDPATGKHFSGCVRMEPIDLRGTNYWTEYRRILPDQLPTELLPLISTGRSTQLAVSLDSPQYLVFADAQGRRIGVNSFRYPTIWSEIPNAIYFGRGIEPQNLASNSYLLQLFDINGLSEASIGVR